ncbi:MAG TPA: OsmC family protein [Rhizomicrobium sp.]
MNETPNRVTVIEDGSAAYAQSITIGRHLLMADEPQSRGGQDAGPSPYDYVLAGLGACTAITVRMYVQRHNWLLTRTTVDLWHEKISSTDGAAVIDRFHRAIRFEGDLTNEQRSRLRQIAEHCPVSETLRHVSIVETAEAIS